VNDNASDQVSGTPALPSTQDAAIGHPGGYAQVDYYFNGTVDDVRVYNRALSASEVKQLYLMGK
jgi:hypothetical protein